MSASTDLMTKRLQAFRLLEAPGHLLRRNHQRSYEIFSNVVGTDVTRQQIAVLIALSQNPGASQNLLVDETGMDKSTLKELLGRMVERGWADRARDPRDQRAWMVSVTEAGLDVLHDRFDRVVATQQEILAPLPHALRPVFLECLHILLGLHGVAADTAVWPASVATDRPTITSVEDRA